MSSASLSDVFLVPCRLVIGPTANGLLSDYPHGGTEVGFIAEGVVSEEAEEESVLSEAVGKNVGVFRGKTEVIVAITMLQWDPTGYALVRRTTTTSSGAKIVRSTNPGLVTAGSPLLIAPIDPKHPAALIYAPVPFYGRAARRLEFSLRQKLETALIFLAAPDANGYDVAVGPLEELNLT